MDNIGDWLYIVLLVIAGVSGLFNSGKKKKRANAFPEPSDHEPIYDPVYDPDPQESKSFRELVEEMTAAPEPLFSTPKKKTSGRSTPPPPPFLTGENAISSAQTTLSPTRGLLGEEETGSGPGISFSDRDELKRAIIISEILNRKY